MERVIWFIENLLALVERCWVQFCKFRTFLFESVNKLFYFFFRAYQAFNFANSCWIFFANVDAEFDSRHIALSDPIETVDIMKQISFDLFDCCGVQLLLLYHLKTSASNYYYKESATSSKRSLRLLVLTSKPNVSSASEGF